MTTNSTSNKGRKHQLTSEVVPEKAILVSVCHSKTTMEQLYAVGETSCNGVHGRNRLASNSLLESLVFAKRAAADIITKKEFKKAKDFDNLVNLDNYEDLPAIMEKYHAMVVEEIKEEARLRSLKEEAV